MTIDEVKMLGDVGLNQAVDLIRYKDTRLTRCPDGRISRVYPDGTYAIVPDYVNDITAALELVDGHFSLLSFTTTWRAKFATPQAKECLGMEEESCFVKWAEAVTPERAIVYAYLLADD